ncbi:MAG: hypothetical protein Rhirs2KO_18630 [Rhizobiaceae bacterium]
MSGCGSDAAKRLAAAEREKAEAELVDEALGTGELPELPADCRRYSASGVTVGDRLDVALLKAERALGRQNARTGRCAAFYDGIKESRAGEQAK